MIIDKIIENGTKILVSAAFTALFGTSTYVVLSGNKDAKTRHKAKMETLQAEYDEVVSKKKK